MRSSQSPRMISVACCVIGLIAMSGCASRVIMVPEGEPLMIAEPIKARVFVMDSGGNMVRSRNRVTIPAGWYALPKD